MQAAAKLRRAAKGRPFALRRRAGGSSAISGGIRGIACVWFWRRLPPNGKLAGNTSRVRPAAYGHRPPIPSSETTRAAIDGARSAFSRGPGRCEVPPPLSRSQRSSFGMTNTTCSRTPLCSCTMLAYLSCNKATTLSTSTFSAEGADLYSGRQASSGEI